MDYQDEFDGLERAKEALDRIETIFGPLLHEANGEFDDDALNIAFDHIQDAIGIINTALSNVESRMPDTTGADLGNFYSRVL